MDLHNIPTSELRASLTKLINDYRYYPNEITKDMEQMFKSKAQSIIDELNIRNVEKWVAGGGNEVANKPTHLSLQIVMSNTR